MKATPKATEIDNLLAKITGKDRREVVGKGCVFCDKPNLNFRDALSRKEYQISGMCQNCQDATFGV